jgi:STELLO glycosyltransferases
MPNKFIVITSINLPTKALNAFSQMQDWQVVVVADRKTPQNWQLPNVKVLTVAEQEILPLETAKLLPWNHYARKNLGYLYAIMNGAQVIYETDDDNIPYESWQSLFPKTAEVEVQAAAPSAKFINAYQHFCNDHVWPRGFPLTEVLTPSQPTATLRQPADKIAPVQQGLADLEPDVDAIYRLTIGKPITFSPNTPLYIGPSTYCPFNSQNTLWYPAAFPLMFLPASIPSRVTDIWRGYIAQRFLHLRNQGVLFCSASVYQERNYHNLHHDFMEEIALYTSTETLVSALDSYDANYAGIMDYLFEHQLVGLAEIALFKAWIQDLTQLGALAA